jgi:hypothetical protein
MPARAELLVLCNTGGREYRALLAEAGFELVETHALPLDPHVMRARLS